MAITGNCSKFLFYSKSQGASFEKSLMLGRLLLKATPAELKDQVALFKNNVKPYDESAPTDGYTEPLLELLGAKTADSVDYSDYEKATIIHDLNQPFPGNMKSRFTTIIDGGTIEHVFNFPVAIKNCMEALQVGGHYIGITPVNNLMGHGFYQFGPELYFNVFSKENGFRVKKMIIVVQYPDERFSDWYEVLDPHEAKSRVMLTNSNPTYIMVLAEKIADVPVFATLPQQSDYQTLWSIKKSLKDNNAPRPENKMKYLYRKYTPRRMKIIMRNIYDLFAKEKVDNEDLGAINPEHFKKVNFNN